MEENDGNMVRFRLFFDDRHLLNKLQRSQGLRRCWFLLKSSITTVGDLAAHIRESFGLRDRIVLFMDDFVLPSFESTCIITDKDIIRIKKKETKHKDICKPCDCLNLLQDSQITRVHDSAFNNNLLANDKSLENSQGHGSYDKEILTSCMENAVHLDPPSSEAGLAKRKKKRSKIKKKEIKQKDICKPCDGLNLLQDSQIARVHDLAFNNNLLADDKSLEKSQGNGSYDKEILTSCMENAVHVDPPSSDAGLAKRKKKRSKGQSVEINHDHEFEPSNNSDVRKNDVQKKQARPEMVHSSDGEGDAVPSEVRPGYISFQPRVHGTQQADETQRLFFDGESSMSGQNRNKESTFPQTTGFDQCFKVDEVSVADGILPLPNPKVMSTANNVTRPPKHRVHFKSLLPLRRLPVTGDILAYRYVELSSSVYAKLSSPQVGKVSSFDYRSLQIILHPVLDYEILLENNPNRAIVQHNASRFKEDGSLEIEYLSLVDVRLLKDHNSEEAYKDDPSRKDNWEEALAKGNLNEPNASTAEQSNGWAKWIPNKSSTSTSRSFKHPNAPLAVGRGNGRTNCAPYRFMNTRTPNLNSTNWNPNRSSASCTANAYFPITPCSYRAPRLPSPWYPHQNNFFLPGGEFSGSGNL